MWVFGYGSLMWDGWETDHGCIQRTVADLTGYCRIFNKASVKNWGTRSTPGPTLNLVNNPYGICRGIAFEFPDATHAEVMSYLQAREGKGFIFQEVSIHLGDKSEIAAFAPVYEGKNTIDGKTSEEIADMVLAAAGDSGTCLSYVKNVAKQLMALHIHDPIVTILLEHTNSAASSGAGLSSEGDCKNGG